MKQFTLTLLLLCSFFSLFAQVYPYDFPNKEQNKVQVEDSLDKLLNDLIDFNESILQRDVAFSEHEEWSFGEIYKLDGDTLQGEIKVKKYQGGQTSMIIFFRENNESKKQKYRADKILGFSLGNRHYVSRKFSNLPPSYIEILEQGNMNLYFTKYRRYAEKYDPVRQVSYPGLYPFYEFYLEPLSDDEKELLGPVPEDEKKFIKVISPYIQEYPELIEKLKQGKYGFSHLREIVQLCNMK